MRVDGLDVDFGVEGVLVDENRASTEVGRVEPICQNIMVNTFNCSLQCDDVPLACDLLFENIFLSTSRSWILVVDAESFLHRRTTGHGVVEAVLLSRCIVSPCGCLAKFCDGLLNIDHMSFKRNIGVCLYPRSVLVLAGRHRILTARQFFFIRKWQLQAFRKRTELLWWVVLHLGLGEASVPFPEGCSTLVPKGAPRLEHQAVPLVSVLKMLPQVVYV